MRSLNEKGIEEGKQGNLDTAIELFRQAIKLDPGYAESYNNLGFAYYRKGNISLALDYFKEATEVDPDYAQARNNYKFLMTLIDDNKND